MSSTLKQAPSGLEVPISTGNYCKVRAALDGLFYWARESQDIILKHLGEFLPRVRETKTSGIFTLLRNGVEVCGGSRPLGKRKPLAEDVRNLKLRIQELQQELEKSDITPEARLLIQNFQLPDPDRLPEFYRTYTYNGEEHLLILWGCNTTKVDLIAPGAALTKLGQEGPFSIFLRKWLPYLLGLLLLLFLILLALLFMNLPEVDLKLSKATASPQEPIRAYLVCKKGQSFIFDSHGATLLAANPSGTTSDTNSNVIWDGIDKDRTADISYPDEGKHFIELTGKGSFFGIPLPPISVSKTVDIIKSVAPIITSQVPATVTATIDSTVLSDDKSLRIRLVTPVGQFPATLEATSSMDGTIKVAGCPDVKVTAGTPAGIPDIKKPGVYPVSLTSNDGSETKRFVKVPGDSKTGLYANLRCSKNEVNVGENLLLDSSASMELDPEARITNREISLDGGQSFTPMKSEYEIVSFDKPGLKTIQLKVTDSKGTQQLDNDRVTVVASEAPKVATLNPDEISKIDTSKGSEYAIPNGILFQTGEAEISEQGKQLLASFAKVIANKNVVVAVDGYTDNVPIVRMGKYADNLQLSEARANSAVDVLVVNGVKREHLRATGKGDSMPAAPNTSSEGRAINRRIKISIIPINNNN